MTINGTEYTENGELDDLIINDRLTFTVTPQEGKAIDELSYNGIVLDSDTTSVTVVKDAVLKVTFQDIIAADSALYVAPDGSDDNNGSIDASFATLEKARDTTRQYRKEGRIPQGGMTVYLREGVYYPTQTFTLSEEDSGTAEKPITYAAYPGEKVSISGGRELDYSLFRPVEGEMKEKLRSKTAQGKVVTASLESLGMTPPGKYPAKDEKYSAPLILFDGHVMQLSRYPNSKLITDWPICDVLNRGYCTRYPADDYRQGEGLMKVQYFDSVLDSWIHNLEDLIFAGYWAETWYCEYLYATLDQQAHTIEALDSMKYGGAGQYNVGVNNGKGRSFCVYNVYEELDEPGEWYIDRKTGMLYLYPVTDAKNPVLKVTNLDRNIIEMTDVSYVTISDLELTSGRQNAVLINGGTRVKIDNCDINTFEQNGVLMSGGTENGVINSHIHHIGLSALNIDSCGDRNTLTHGNNYLTNSEINDFAPLGEYSNGINLSECVGVKVDHNEIYNSSHIGVLFLGSENVIEYNEFHDLVKNSADSGAIYTGRDWRDHGNEIRYNHFYNIGSSMAGGSRPCGFFTDDGSSDSLVYGNVFGPGVEHAQANKVHAGQDNMFYHNLYIDTPNVYYSYMWNNRKWENYILGENVSDEIVASYHKKLIQVNENPLYLAKWPWLGNTSNRATIQNESNTLRENLIIYVNQSPSKNMVAVNSDDPTLVLYGYQDQQTNRIVYDRDKELFADFDGSDYTLVKSAYPENFPKIPFDMIGRIDNTDLEAYLNQASAIVKEGSVGEHLGDYTQAAVEQLAAAIAQAENTDTITAAALLKAALSQAEESRVRKAVATENPYSLPGLLEDGQLETGDVKNGLTLSIPEAMGNTTVTGTFGETPFRMEWESGTVVSPHSLSLRSPEKNSAGIDVSGEVVASIGTAETTFSKPVRRVLLGMGKKRAFCEENGKLSAISKMTEDSADALKGSLGYVRSGDDLVIWMKQGGELVLGTGLVLPSEEADPTPSIPVGGSGTGTGGGGVSTGIGIPSSPKTYESKFTDITGHWAENDINEMAKKEIVKGVTETSFEPDRSITRAEFAALAVRGLKITATDSESLFEDVTPDAWYGESVIAAASAGLIQGYEGKFRPEDTITREEIAVVMMKAYQFLGKTAAAGDLTGFTDSDQISDWAKPFAAQAVGAGLISGMTDNTFAPRENATRAQATSILKRLLDQ